MGRTIQENIEAFAAAEATVKNHPMCGKIEDTGTQYFVTYPSGDFPVDGVRINYTTMGKIRALEILHDRMETHWTGSYPAVPE